MGLRVKFNIMLILAALVGLVIAGLLSYRILQRNARDEVIQHARIMIESALAIRAYTVQEIRPLLIPMLDQQFFPQTVSAYAATQNFHALREQFPDYTYKEAALNPTNPRDRATDWEADIIHEFRNNPDRQEIILERQTPTGRILNLARPLQIRYEGCLDCHGNPEEAPATMIAQYGSNNGFGWQLNEVVGSQIVSVPMSLPLERALQTFLTFMGALGFVFVTIIILLNVLLHFVVIQPVKTMSQIANEVSMGRLDAQEYQKAGNDEIASLSASFNRMRRSLENAMRMLED